MAQNTVEIDIGKHPNYPVARVYESGNNGLWLEMERARKCTPKTFMKIVGVNIHVFRELLLVWNNEKKGLPRSRFGTPPEYEQYVNSGENEFMNSVLDLMADYSMPYGDIARLSSWGVVVRDGQEKLVLIDFGLTDMVFNDYYSK